MDALLRPVTDLRGVGSAVAAKLARLGIATLTHLLFHLPSGYQDRTRLTPIRDLIQGQEALVQGKIVDARTLYGRGRFRRMRLVLQEHGFNLNLTFFNFSYAMQKAFAPGVELRCYGRARASARGGGLEIAHPECTFITPNNPPPLSDALTPIYPLTQGISQRQLRQLIEYALQALRKQDLPQLLPLAKIELTAALREITSINLVQALETIHNPPPAIGTSELLNKTHPAQFRLALEELTAFRLVLLREKQGRHQQTAPVLKQADGLGQEFRRALTFTLTDAQEKSIQEIARDLTQPHPMKRLLQGDVGSGKTVVAALAALQAIQAGCQVALMAPTEILAEQHLAQFDKWFRPLDLRIAPLLGRMNAKAKRINGIEIAEGGARLVIGTHALFQEAVVFAKLGLCIIDEQHRFGVDQRLRLHRKGEHMHPHQLLMTATPIPRTLAQTMYANMDLSSIRELPPGRIPCETLLLSAAKRPQLIERIRNQLTQGAQAYWVCPLIEESEHLEAEAAEKTVEALKKAMPEVAIDLVHGRYNADAKQMAMQNFQSGKTRLLVATTVIEVGIDVPTANLMVIENAERLGLAQLHQLRGRVGRGGQQSYCILCYQEPLSAVAKQRLQLIRDNHSGFDLAEADMKLRGIGEILGTRQSGAVEFKIANPIIHRSINAAICELSDQMLHQSKDQQDALIHRWLGSKEQYGAV